MNPLPRKGAIPEWAWIVLTFLLVFAVWWRGHTIGPSVRDRTRGVVMWPVVRGQTEPLDCDEAAYGYMGRRINEGAVLYRDLVENKPPGGYWIYALAVAIGGATEWTVRVLPIPLVLATLLALWKLGLAIASPFAGCFVVFLYIVLSTDPYLYGNGAQLELALNLFSMLSLLAMAQCLRRHSVVWSVGVGVALGVAALVRQTALINLPLYLCWILFSRQDSAETNDVPPTGRLRRRQALAVVAGVVLTLSAAIAMLMFQGAGPAFFENVIQGGFALVADTPPPAKAPSMWVRWLTGNADPNGVLPPPFGVTRYLVWWGRGSWPLWLAGFGSCAWLMRPGSSQSRRLIAWWTLCAFIQVAMPRQFWAHYYLLPTPGIALCVAVALSDLLGIARGAWRAHGHAKSLGAGVGCVVLLAAVVATCRIQVEDYLLVAPEQLTIRYKGGAQWVRLRSIGRELGRRANSWKNPKLFVWGWQSPLYFYSRLNSPSRHFFVNDLVRAQADRPHPLVSRWMDELLADLNADRPLLIFTGYPPFSGLRQLIEAAYARSDLVPEAPVLWILREDQARYDAAERVRRSGVVRVEAPPLGIWEWLPIPRPVAAQPSAGNVPSREGYPLVEEPRN